MTGAQWQAELNVDLKDTDWFIEWSGVMEDPPTCVADICHRTTRKSTTVEVSHTLFKTRKSRQAEIARQLAPAPVQPPLPAAPARILGAQPMAMGYRRDDDRRLVVVTGYGPFVTNHILQAIERQRDEGTWSYGMLYDLRSTRGHPSIAELREIMAKVASLGGSMPPRGPVALVTADPSFYEAGCAYAAMWRTTLRVDVFRDFGEAAEWLFMEMGA